MAVHLALCPSQLNQVSLTAPSALTGRHDRWADCGHTLIRLALRSGASRTCLDGLHRDYAGCARLSLGLHLWSPGVCAIPSR
jgi:hypothetical protein